MTREVKEIAVRWTTAPTLFNFGNYGDFGNSGNV
jgi:hypothetical protein